MSDTGIPTNGRLPARRLLELFAITQKQDQVVTWTTPFQRASKCLDIAGEALEFRDRAAARYALRMHLRHVQSLLSCIEMDEARDLAIERDQFRAGVSGITAEMLGSVDEPVVCWPANS